MGMTSAFGKRVPACQSIQVHGTRDPRRSKLTKAVDAGIDIPLVVER